MAPVVHTPVRGFTGTVAGVNFADGAGETDDAAALLYFRSAGYDVEDAEGEQEQPDADEPEGLGDGEQPAEQPDDESDAEEPDADAEGEQEQPERPHPVQGSKAVWFEHLSKLKPDHGFDLETVSRKELIAAVEAIEGN